MDIGAGLTPEVLRERWSGPARHLVAFFGRRPGQNAAQFFFGLLVNFGRATFALSIVEAGGTFLVESADPFVDRMKEKVKRTDPLFAHNLDFCRTPVV